MITSLAAATSAAAPATVAPSSRNVSDLLAVRFQTVRGKPARATFAAIGPPISPSPMNPVAVPVSLIALLPFRLF